MGERKVGRGAFLSVVGAGGIGLLFGDRIVRSISGPLADAGSIVPGAIKDVFPSGWRIYAINPPWPTFTPASYTLDIGGHVKKPMTLAWSDVRALPAVAQTTTFHCVTGWTVSNVHWKGVRFQTLWDMVEPLPTAHYVNFVSMERGYTDTLSIEQSLLPEVMLAHTMDDAPLTRAHGAPLRVVIPEMYGYKNVKWVHRIELVPDLQPGFWERNGYDVDAWVGRSNGY
jgi:DMSO/TMAO reductase YedYZ molybdopterin-dependent catalytic subunit